MLKFYMTPGSCSTGIHILLEELELVFEVRLVDLLAGDQHRADYLAVNPKATIPALEYEDGGVLTDFQSIAWWLARQHPKAGLLPSDLRGEIQVLEVMQYVVGTIHMQGFTRIFTTDTFTPTTTDHGWVQHRGREIIDNGFRLIGDLLPETGYLTGSFTIADAALFYTEFWADKTAIELPAACRRHYQLMLQRPAVRRVLAEEGYRLS